MPTPRPGTAVRGSTTGQPLMALFDLLGRRWTMRILWEIDVHQPTFRELQTLCGEMSSSVLNTRLSELKEVLLVTQGDRGYALTTLGQELMADLAPLRQWAQKWDGQLSTDR